MEPSNTHADLTGLRVFISYPRGGLAHSWAKLLQQDLEARGVAVAWRDETDIEEGDQNWLHRIEEGLERCDILAYLLTKEEETSDWVTRELLTAQEKHKPILPLRVEPAAVPHILKEKQPVEHRGDQADTLKRFADALLREWRKSLELNSPQTQAADVAALLHSLQRKRELEWLDDIIHVDYSDRADLYVTLAAEQQQSRSLERAMKSVRMDTRAIFEDFGLTDAATQPQQQKHYEDVLQAYRDLCTRPVRRLAVLGEPGAGKSFSLERIALEYAKVARQDPEAPIPLLVPLGRWTRDAQSLESFIESALGGLGRHFTSLREQGRAVLLLDAMNEIPPGQRRHKARQIQHLAEDNRFKSVVVSCRERDFASDFQLPFDTLSLQPLKPRMIRDFIRRILSLYKSRDATQDADTRFWQIAGGETLKQAWLDWQGTGGVFDEFFSGADWPDWYHDMNGSVAARKQMLADRRSLLHLASNPYLLKILAILPELTTNRAKLLQGFLRGLYREEKEARERRNDSESVPEQAHWLAVMGQLAEAMQLAGAQGGDGAQTVLAPTDWPTTLTKELLGFSQDASVLQLTAGDVRFTHQLLQEYLASRVLLSAYETDPLSARLYWSEGHWWLNNAWDEVAKIAVESLEADETKSFIAWLARANPALAAEIWQELGSPALEAATRQSIHDQWLPCMTDIEHVPEPQVRALIATALSRFGLDDRPGIGLSTQGLPDIDWIEIPAGPFIYGEGNKQQELSLERFLISRYPITCVQYQAFVNDEGYSEEKWWQGLEQISQARYTDVQSNWPVTEVSWYEAMAFSRWLAERLQQPIRLPTEQEWEKAARGADGRRYPWGQAFIRKFANVHETAKRTNRKTRTMAVGIYPQGGSPYGVMDMAGNIQEWCLNQYFHPAQTGLDTNQDPEANPEWRVLRGGSWFRNAEDARAARRYGRNPLLSDNGRGFRVVLAAPID